MDKMIKKPFVAQRLDEEKINDKSKVVPVRLNKDELKALEAAGVLIEEEKLSSVMKVLMELGLVVIHEPKTALICSTIFRNNKNNKRRGVSVVEPKFSKM